MSRLTVLVCEDWESGQQQGGKAKCWCLHLPPVHPAWVRTACSKQHAGLAGEGAGRDAGIWVVPCAEPWCCWPWTASPSCCCSFSWVLVEHSLLAAGRVVTGSCWDFTVPQVFHRLLLSSWSFCFPVALSAILCFLTLSASEASSSCFFGSLVLRDFWMN